MKQKRTKIVIKPEELSQRNPVAAALTSVLARGDLETSASKPRGGRGAGNLLAAHVQLDATVY